MIPGAQQARQRTNGNGVKNVDPSEDQAQQVPFGSTLVNNPKSLHLLWQE